ncbi:MAG TPA: sporulation peptidase YabG [Clostridiales bacterium]|nr:sporulation peptidase YabG [Clostridiales bacterium]
MRKIKKGDIVGRISYGKDILFVVDRIIKTSDKNEFAILKGLTVRIKADSPIDDLEIVEKRIVQQNIKSFENKIEDRLRKCLYYIENDTRSKRIFNCGRILHLDGDKKYSEKSLRYYRSLGLEAVVKNIPESKQSKFVRMLLEKYKPDILVITGHDGMIKKGTKYNDIYNYRNSIYFIKSVMEARKWNSMGRDLVIFAGACQSYYEAIMDAGANFASSPGRILIDFMDPLIVAEKVAITDESKYVTISDIENELRDGIKGVNGIGAIGKKKVIVTKM